MKPEISFESDIMKFWIEDNILFGTYKVKNIDLKVAKQATIERLEFTNHKDYVTIVDYTNVKSTNKEARDYYATDEPSSHIIAMAAMVNSPVGSIIANFYLKLSKPAFPFKVFTDIEKAKSWLANYIPKT